MNKHFAKNFIIEHLVNCQNFRLLVNIPPVFKLCLKEYHAQLGQYFPNCICGHSEESKTITDDSFSIKYIKSLKTFLQPNLPDSVQQSAEIVQYFFRYVADIVTEIELRVQMNP